MTTRNGNAEREHIVFRLAPDVEGGAVGDFLHGRRYAPDDLPELIGPLVEGSIMGGWGTARRTEEFEPDGDGVHARVWEIRPAH